jgi:hypothetical protein
MRKWPEAAMIASVLLASAGNAYASPVPVPEIDAGGAITALGVLAGVAALFAERLRRK